MAREYIVINGSPGANGSAKYPVGVEIQGSTGPIDAEIARNQLSYDAWGRHKSITDLSLFHGLWTYSVPNRLWEERTITSGVATILPQTGTNCSSVENMLEVRSGTVAGDGAQLQSKRHPRYQPNRGHLFSTATILPDPTADGIRRFGLATEENGVYFELEGDGSDWVLYAVRVADSVVKTREVVTTPDGFDPAKGHVYDIQFQWRGVGNYKWFINLEEAYTDDVLGTLTELSVNIPALPVYYSSTTNTTTEIKIKAGCVDVTSEGGDKNGREFASISTGTSLLPATSGGTAMIGIKMPRTVSYGAGQLENTLDAIASKLTSWTRDEAALQVFMARDVVATNLDGLTWGQMPDSHIEVLVGGDGSTLDDAFQLDRASMQLILNEWHDVEEKNMILNPDQAGAPFILTAGDIMICTVQSFAGTDSSSMTLYLSEEI